MKYLGIGGSFMHDAGLALLDDQGNINFASQSERYTGKKHDGRIPLHMWENLYYPFKDNIQLAVNDDWVERERFRQGYLDSWKRDLPQHFSGERIEKLHPSEYTRLGAITPQHHLSHACGAFFTRPESFAKEDCVLAVIDGIGEFRSAALFDHNLNLVQERTFPLSIGYIYAWFTEHCGLRSNEDEYVVMGLSCYGEPTHWKEAYELIQCIPQWHLDDQDDWDDLGWKKKYQVKKLCINKVINYLSKNCKSLEDQAASLQRATEEYVLDFMKEARKYGSKLCYSGGVAQNIMANTRIRDLFDDVWVDVCPGDGGSCLGAAAYAYWKDTGKDRINWTHPFLGNEIEGTVDPEEVVSHILEKKVCGIANGRAEFSPRAYGNRSLIADVRYDVKDTVNEIKKRQKYRPFAPAILEEHADEYFEGKMNRWMQYTAKAKHGYSSVTHVDGTGRVQLVPKDCHSVFRKVIECYYEKTGVPMLLNTSLNIRGKPMVNTSTDALLFESEYGVKVFS